MWTSTSRKDWKFLCGKVSVSLEFEPYILINYFLRFGGTCCLRLLYREKKEIQLRASENVLSVLPEQTASLPRTPPCFYKMYLYELENAVETARTWFDAKNRSSWGRKLTRISAYWSSYVYEISDWYRCTAWASVLVNLILFKIEMWEIPKASVGNGAELTIKRFFRWRRSWLRKAGAD
jgi:hypothetical protein